MSKQKFVILKEYENNLALLMNILGSGTTDNIELNKIGKILFGDAFVGVFSSNKMKPLNNNEMCIVNTDPDYKGGTHCVLVINIIIKHMYMTRTTEILNLYRSIGNINTIG